MKKWILAVAGIVAAAGAAQAQDGPNPGERPQGERRAPPTADEMLKTSDKDGDGKLSKEEYLRNSFDRMKSSQRFAARLAELDTNKDGDVSFEEYLASPMAAERFTAADKDGSGFLEKGEIEAMLAERGGRFGGGQRGGGQGGQGGAQRAAEMVKRFDTNGDGKVTREEFQAPPELFDRLDRNKDGVLDAADIPPQGERPGAPPAPPQGTAETPATTPAPTEPPAATPVPAGKKEPKLY